MVASRKKKEYLSKKQTDDVLVKFAVSYTRVSTGKQTKEWKTGINRQEKAWIKWLLESQKNNKLMAFFLFLIIREIKPTHTPDDWDTNKANL